MSAFAPEQLQGLWLVLLPSKAGDNASLWAEQYLPRLVNSSERTYPYEDPDRETSHADVYLTLVAERRA